MWSIPPWSPAPGLGGKGRSSGGKGARGPSGARLSSFGFVRLWGAAKGAAPPHTLSSHMPHANYPYADAPRLPLGTDPVDPRTLLNTQQAVELEIGCGKGSFILERLDSDPAVHIFGMEIKRKLATLVDRKIADRGFGGRGRVFAEDVRLALPRFPDGCLSRIYVHFPDPWWKKRHAKRILADTTLADAAARLLAGGGDFFVQTDVEERAELYEAVFNAHPAFEPWGESARIGDPEFGARSPREKRAIADGLPIYRLRWRRRTT